MIPGSIEVPRSVLAEVLALAESGQVTRRDILDQAVELVASAVLPEERTAARDAHRDAHALAVRGADALVQLRALLGQAPTVAEAVAHLRAVMPEPEPALTTELRELLAKTTAAGEASCSRCLHKLAHHDTDWGNTHEGQPALSCDLEGCLCDRFIAPVAAPVLSAPGSELSSHAGSRS